jgi:DNA-binding NtrC family response regulator
MKTDTDSSSEFCVLVVDNEEGFRKHLVQYLSGEGFRVIEANSTSEACALIRKRKASLVLLDWDLHNDAYSEEPSSGSEVLRTCHEVDALLPVVVMSGAQHLAVCDDSLEAGADCFLKKPFALRSLTVLLHRWIGRVKAEKNPFTQLSAGVIATADVVNREYTRAVVEKVGSALRAAPKLGLSRQTVASYLASPALS